MPADQVVKADAGLLEKLRGVFDLRVLTLVGIVGGILIFLRRLKKKAPAVTAPKTTVVSAGPLPAGFKRFTLEEVAQHNKDDDAWFIHEGAVYDATKYLGEHPGGAQVIVEVAGRDATADFNDVGHSDAAMEELWPMCIGVVGNAELPAAVLKNAPPVEAEPVADSLVTLNPKVPVDLKLTEKITLSHNVRKFRFALPTPEHRLGLPVGKHFTVEYTGEDGSKVKRAYTPVTGDEVQGYVDLVIKVYFANEHPKFPQGGKMSQHMEAMKIGDTLKFMGPIGRWEYHGKSNWSWKGAEKRKSKKFNMIAGGTGITPMLQVVTNMLRDPDDESQVALLFANQSPDDIILRDEIDALQKEHPTRFKRWYTVDRVPDGEEWSFSKGFIDETMCREHLYSAGDDTVNLLCGPPPMLKFACQPNLAKCDHKESSIFSF